MLMTGLSSQANAARTLTALINQYNLALDISTRMLRLLPSPPMGNGPDSPLRAWLVLSAPSTQDQFPNLIITLAPSSGKCDITEQMQALEWRDLKEKS